MKMEVGLCGIGGVANPCNNLAPCDLVPRLYPDRVLTQVGIGAVVGIAVVDDYVVA